jgi:uncharacterized protein YlxW (UPF0749 family)
MLKNLIRKMVSEAMTEQTSKPDQAAEISRLQSELSAERAEKAKLQEKLESSSASKALVKLKELAATVPDGAQGGGMIAVIENGVVKNLTLSSKADLTAVIARAEAGGYDEAPAQFQGIDAQLRANGN